MLRSLLAAFALLFIAAPAAAAPTTADVMREGAFREGAVDGHWVGLVLQFTGTNGFADHADVYTVGPGGNGPGLFKLAPIVALGPSGDRIVVDFVGGKMYVANPVYPNGVAHCCPVTLRIRRYGFRADKLVVERTGTAPTDASTAAIVRAVR